VNNLRQALQDLLKEYEKNKGRTEASEDLDTATVHLEHKLKDLRRHLRRAIVDQVSDAFSTIDAPLQMLILYAQQGDQARTHQAAELFQQHSDNLSRVAELVCKMSPDLEGVAMLRYSAHLLKHLTPQVVNAAFVRCLRPNDPEADENLNRFAELWKERAFAMTLAMDSLISVDDFMAVTQEHINDDVKNGVSVSIAFEVNSTIIQI
jgi:catenin alpha